MAILIELRGKGDVMADLPQDVLLEIERKVDRFRALVTNAARKRWKHQQSQSLKPSKTDRENLHKAIFNLWLEGFTSSEISERTGYSRSYVMSLANRMSWSGGGGTWEECLAAHDKFIEQRRLNQKK